MDGTPAQRGQAEKTGAVQLWGDPIAAFQYIKGGYKK